MFTTTRGTPNNAVRSPARVYGSANLETVVDTNPLASGRSWATGDRKSSGGGLI